MDVFKVMALTFISLLFIHLSHVTHLYLCSFNFSCLKLQFTLYSSALNLFFPPRTAGLIKNLTEDKKALYHRVIPLNLFKIHFERPSHQFAKAGLKLAILLLQFFKWLGLQVYDCVPTIELFKFL